MKRALVWLAVIGVAVLVLAACSGDDEPEADDSETTAETGSDGTTEAAPAQDLSEVTIAFSAPGADHGWLAAITDNAQAKADELGVDFVLTEGTNDSAAQESQIRTLIDQDPDALVILPHEGDPLTPVAQEAMQAGIPVINIDRAFSSPSAYRTWIGGDNYGIGFAAGNYFAEQLDCEGNVVEIQGIAGISVTELRTQGFMDAIEQCDGGIEVVASQAADFLPDKGLQVMSTILQAEDQIDAVYTHDDDMAMGVVSAIENAGREDEMWVTGAGGSSQAMEMIQEGGLYRATFLYNPSMAASAIELAALIAQGQGMSDLVEPEVPSYIQLPASTVTADNVEQFLDFGY
jgi:ribose transport system substrate-binding protein